MTRNLETKGNEKMSSGWHISPTRKKRETKSVIITKMPRNTKMDAETFTNWLNINKKVAYMKVTNCTKITKLVNLGKLL